MKPVAREVELKFISYMRWSDNRDKMEYQVWDQSNEYLVKPVEFLVEQVATLVHQKMGGE
jgi:hypothetical protein